MKTNVYDKILSRMTEGSCKVDFWDGTSKAYGRGEPTLAFKIQRPLSTLRLARDPLMELGEAYVNGVIDTEQDLQEVFEWLFKNQKNLEFSMTHQAVRRVFAKLGGSTSLTRQKRDVQHHYDLGNDFFALWLDKTMSYSCGYFESTDDSLETAQINKIDHTLRKLQLKPGETLLDIGSGWGWLIIRAAQQYQVKATGITLSEEQYSKTKERIAQLGIQEQVGVELMDYRELAISGRKFDKIASVGMLEHVGKVQLGPFMAVLSKLLKPGGLVLLHSITGMNENEVNAWIEKNIFPGGYIPSLREIIWLLAENDFHVLDIESLRLHYAMTLDHWARRFEEKVDQVLAQRGETFVRMWRLYLRGCAESFRMSGLDIHQILFSKGLNNKLPLTRHYLYQS